jgi:hypothetical protein
LWANKIENDKGLIKKEEKGEKTKKEPRGNYPEYTPTTRERILQECVNTKFMEAEVRFPREIRKSSADP